MVRKNKLWKRWSITFAGQFLFTQILIYFALIVGKFVCENMMGTWYQDDITYIRLKWIEENQWTFLFLTFFASAVFWAIFHFYRISKAMSRIIESVDGIYESKDDIITLPSEMGSLENRLNEVRLKTKADMQAAQEANQRKNELIMYMAHDLKTPLTSVIGYLTLVCEEKDIPWDVKEKYMNIALKKSLRLEELTNEFFDITRFNFSHMILEKSSVNISMMLQQMISEFMTEFAKKELETVCEIESDCWILCDTDKMERVFDNIIKNIVNYSYAGTKIKIRLHRLANEQIEITTENRGKTIPKEMQEHIFEQFFRLDNSRTSETGGSGLGLAVAKEIVTLHGGSISCRSENEKIVFKIILPGLCGVL